MKKQVLLPAIMTLNFHSNKKHRTRSEASLISFAGFRNSQDFFTIFPRPGFFLRLTDHVHVPSRTRIHYKSQSTLELVFVEVNDVMAGLSMKDFSQMASPWRLKPGLSLNASGEAIQRAL